MGLRERVTITLVIIALIQIACRHCMPRTPSKASLKRYLNDVKPVKNNPVPTPYSPSRINKTPKHTFGKTTQNGRISQSCLPKKSLYQTYKFPENEYPLDNSPRDPFRTAMTFNDNNHVNTLQKARNLQSSRINDLKKEMKMKRKLLGNKQIKNENSLQKDMSSIKFSSNHDSMRLLDSVTFPEIQYPLSTMETWGPNYWNHLPFDEEKQLNGFRQQAFNLKTQEDMNNPFTRLTRAKASKYLQSYDKLKEENKRTSTEHSKRSNAGQKGLNFTKTATCERVSDDFITASLVSNIAGKSTDMKKTLEPATNITPSLENICPVTKDSYYTMPIPYKVIEDNSQKVCPAFELKNNTKELQDFDTEDIAQTLHLIEEILLYDDTSSSVPTGNLSKEIENNVNLSDSIDGLSNENTSNALLDCAKNCTNPSTEELSEKDYDNVQADILQDIKPLHPEEILEENTTIVSGPLNVRMPFPSTDTITNNTHPNLTSTDQTNMAPSSKSNAVPGTTSIIIIPINNNNFDGKSLSHLLEQIMSSSLDNSVPNNRLHNVLSNIAPLQNCNPSSTALASELLNSISDSGSSLPIYETLPTNSMCYNNESSPSAMKEKLISDILIHKSLTDDAPFGVKSWDEKLSHQPIETGNSVINTGTRSPIPDFKHPLFDFANGEFTDEVNQGLYNELPILAREISSGQQNPNVSSENLFMSTQNVTSEYLHKNISKDTFQPSQIANDALTVAVDQNFSSEIPTDSIPPPVNEMLPTPLIETTVEQPLPTEALLTPTPLSETLSHKLSEITDSKLPSSPVSTKDSAPQLLDITPSPSTNVNDSPMLADVSLKTELYKIRRILDKMLSSEVPTDSQTVSIDTILSPNSNTDRLPLLVNKSLGPTQTPTNIVLLPAIDKTTLPVLKNDGQQAHEKFPHIPLDGISSDTLLLPVNKSHIPNLLLDTVDSPPYPTNVIGPPTPVLENPADNKPYLLDNLVIPLCKTRTKDPLNNDLSPTMVDLPSKMDLIIPDIYEDSSDDLQLSVVDLPIMVHQTPVTTLPSGDSHIQQFVTQEIEPKNFSFDDSFSNLLHPTNVSSVSEALEAVSPEVSESHSKTISNYTEKGHQNCTPPKVHSSEDVKPQQVNSPLSKQKMADDILTVEPSLLDDSPLSVSDKIAKVTKTPTGTKDLSLDMGLLLPIEDTTNPDTLVTDIPEAVTLALTNGQQSIDLDETSDKLLSKPILFEITPDNLPLPEDKLVPYIDNTPTDSQLPNKKKHSPSKLPIAKALLENVLSDITKGGLSSPLKAKTLSVTPSSFMDKTLYHVDVESPIAEAKHLSPVNPKKTKDILSVDRMQSEISLVDIPTDLPLRMDKTYNDKTDILTEGIETQEETETLSLGKPAVDVPLPTDKVSLPNDNTQSRTSLPNQSISSSKLPITKAILDNVLSDLTSKDFTLQESKSLPVKSSSILNKTLYIIESPVYDINEDSPSLLLYEILPKNEHSDNLTDNNLPLSLQTDSLQLKLVKNLSVTPSSFMDKTLYHVDVESPIAEAKNLFPVNPKKTEDILSVDKMQSDTSFVDIPTDLPLRMDKTYNDKTDILTEGIETQKETETLSLGKPAVDVPLPTDKVSLSNDNTLSRTSLPNQNISSSQLPITKAILNNVLSDITSKDFTLQVSKSLPVKSSSILNKTLYSIESPVYDINEDSPSLLAYEILPKNEHSDDLTDNNLPLSVQTDSLQLKLVKNISVTPSSFIDKTLYHVDLESPIAEAKNVSPVNPKKTEDILSVDKMQSDTSLVDIPTDLPLRMGKTYNDKSDILTEDIETQEETETLSLGKPAVDVPLPTDKVSLPNDNTQSRTSLPNQNISSSKLPITKAILDNVLSDITSRNFILQVSKSLPVKSSSILNKTLYSIESPVYDINEDSPSLLVYEILPKNEHSDHLTANNLPLSVQTDSLRLKLVKNLSVTPSSFMDKTLYHVDVESPIAEAKNLSPVNPKKTEDILSVDEMQSEISLVDIPTDLPLRMDKTYNDKSDILTEDIETQEATETLSLGKPAVDVPLPTDKVSLPNDNTRSRTSLPNQNICSSKLPITKAILDNVLSDITSRNFTLQVSKSLPVKSSSVLNKTLYSIESPVYDINEDCPSLLVYEILPKNEHSDNLTDNNLPLSVQTDSLQLKLVKNLSVTSSSFMDKTLYHVDVESPIAEAKNLFPVNPKKTEDILSVDKMQSDTSLVGWIPTNLPLRMDKTYNDKSDILTEGIETQEETETLSLGKPAVDVPLPTDKVSLPNDNTLSRTSLPNQNISSSKLSITKAILDNVLSDITSRDFTLQVSKYLPVKSSSILNKTLYSIESPVYDINENTPSLLVYEILPKNEHSDNLTDNNLPLSVQTDSLQLKLVKNLSEVSNLDIPTESSLTDKILPDSNDNVSTTKPEIEIIRKNTSSDLLLGSGNTIPSSKLQITKALLENVLSNIKTNGFPLPGKLSIPVESRSQLDKTLYLMESPHSNLNEKSSLPDIQNINNQKENDFELSLEKIFLDNPNLDMPTDELQNDQVYNEDSNVTPSDYPIDDINDLQTPPVFEDHQYHLSSEKSSLPGIPSINNQKENDFELSLEKVFLDNPNLDMPTDELPNVQVYNKDSYETSSDYPTDDIDDLQTQVDKIFSVSDNKSYNLPLLQTIPMFASRIPITMP